jgi:hypothetical protein
VRAHGAHNTDVVATPRWTGVAEIDVKNWHDSAELQSFQPVHHPMKRTFVSLLAALACSTAAASEPTCAQQIGAERATLLAQQCRQVSPATRPPCNAANTCSLVIDEWLRGCEFLGNASRRPAFCQTVDRAGTFQGHLFSGGGTDAVHVTVLTDKGERIFAYCDAACGDLFSEPDEHEVVALRKTFVGKRVTVDVAIERNADRIPGPGTNDRIPLVKRLKLLK